MAKARSTDTRAALRDYYVRADRLQAQLGAQAETLAPVRVTAALPEGDIAALAFIVMIEASKSAQEDLRAIMAEVKALGDAKRRARKLLGEKAAKAATLDADTALQFAAVLSAAELRRELVELLGDDLEAQGELAQLRLQMMMDRVSKMMTTLSNILKKLAETQAAIVQNLK